MNNHQKKQLVIVINNIDGGTGTYLTQLYQLQNLIPGLTIHTLCLHKPQYRNIDVLNISFFQADDAQPQKFSLQFTALWRYLRIAWWMHRQLSSRSPDFIISIDIYCNIIVALLHLVSFKNRSKLILTTHINLKENIKYRASGFLRSILKSTVSSLYNVADKVIAVSSDITKQHITYFNIKESKCMTILNGVRIAGNKRRKRMENRIVSVGRLVPQKDFDTLISAVGLVAKKIPEIELIIYGEGPERASIEKMAQEKSVADKVVLKGWSQNVTKEFSHVDLFTFSSNREGFGYVIIEAMSKGLPVISTDTPYGPAEILCEGKYGILVPMKDAKAMSDAIISLLTDPEKYSYFSKQSLKRAAFYSEQAMLQAYYSLLQTTE